MLRLMTLRHILAFLTDLMWYLLLLNYIFLPVMFDSVRFDNSITNASNIQQLLFVLSSNYCQLMIISFQLLTSPSKSLLQLNNLFQLILSLLLTLTLNTNILFIIITFYFLNQILVLILKRQYFSSLFITLLSFLLQSSCQIRYFLMQLLICLHSLL